MSRRSPEKAIVAQGDELMSHFGFTSIHFSQARASQQTEGIADRRYYRAPLKRDVFPFSHAVWWEAKTPNGKQSRAQRAFQTLVESCGEYYVCGGIDALQHYLVKVCLARYVPGGIEGLRKTVRHSA